MILLQRSSRKPSFKPEEDHEPLQRILGLRVIDIERENTRKAVVAKYQAVPLVVEAEIV